MFYNLREDAEFANQREEIYVSDGYGNSSVVKFDREGNFVKAWGEYGTGPSEFNLPHSIAVDRQGNVYEGDRENKRIQIFDADGNLLKEWSGIGYPYGLFITADQHVWMIDGGYDRIVELDQGGKIIGALGERGHEPGQFAWGHFLAVGKDGKICAAGVLNWRFQVFVSTGAKWTDGEVCSLQENVLGPCGELRLVNTNERAEELRICRANYLFNIPRKPVCSEMDWNPHFGESNLILGLELFNPLSRHSL